MADKTPRGIKKCSDPKKHPKHRWGDEEGHMWLCGGK